MSSNEQLAEIESQILELEEKRKIWLEENHDFIHNLLVLVESRGVSMTYPPRRYPWIDHEVLEFKCDNIRAVVWFDMGEKYLPTIQEFETRDILRVSVGPHSVCYYEFTNHPRPNKSQWLFIPGAWCAALTDDIEQAKNKELAITLAEKKKELCQIKKNLLIGVDI